MTPHGEVGPPSALPLPGCFSQQADPCGKTGQVWCLEQSRVMAAVASPGRGDEAQNGTGCPSTVPSPVRVQGRHSHAPLPGKLMPVPPTHQGGGAVGATGHLDPPLRPRGRLGTGEPAMCHPVPVPPTACARAQQYRECLAFPVPAGCLPAAAGSSLPGRRRRGDGRVTATLPSPFPVPLLPAAPHMAPAMGLAPPPAQDPKPLTPGAVLPPPRTPASLAQGWEPGAGSVPCSLHLLLMMLAGFLAAGASSGSESRTSLAAWWGWRQIKSLGSRRGQAGAGSEGQGWAPSALKSLGTGYGCREKGSGQV